MSKVTGKRLLKRDEAIAAEVERLRAVGYGVSHVTRRNGRTLSIEEEAADNVDRAEAGVQEITRSRKAPGAQTDREFFAGLNLHKQYQHEQCKLDEIVAGAKRHGYTPMGDEIYQEGFEKDEKDVGNPEYFISSKNGGRSQLKKLRKSRGLSPALR